MISEKVFGDPPESREFSPSDHVLRQRVIHLPTALHGSVENELAGSQQKAQVCPIDAPRILGGFLERYWMNFRNFNVKECEGVLFYPSREAGLATCFGCSKTSRYM